MLCTLSSPLEVLRISTVVDLDDQRIDVYPLEVLRISTVVDPAVRLPLHHLWKC